MTDKQSKRDYERIHQWALNIPISEKFYSDNPECGVDLEIEEINDLLEELEEKTGNLISDLDDRFIEKNHYKLIKVITFRGREEDRIEVDTFPTLLEARNFQQYLIVNGKTMIDNGRLVKWEIEDANGVKV